jgi:DNA-binding NarL/FixJ family response regulator
MPEAITVLLADDHALVRRAFRRILDDEAGILVIGEAGNGIEAVQQARVLKPRVVLMDCAMPGSNGLSATREIAKTFPGISVVILSMHAENTWVRRAIDAGARGYVLKTTMDLDLASVIKRVVAGELVFGPQLNEPPASKAGRKCDLSPREREVLQLIVNGRSTKEIALQLGLSENTVGVHRANLMSTLGVRRTAELVVFAIQNGLVPLA